MRTAIEAKAALARALADRQCLLIVDDVAVPDMMTVGRWQVIGIGAQRLPCARRPGVMAKRLSGHTGAPAGHGEGFAVERGRGSRPQALRVPRQSPW